MILLPVKSPVVSVVYRIALFKAFLSASVADGLAWSRSSCVFTTQDFTNIFTHSFSKGKNP